MSIENNLQLMERFVEFINTSNEQLAQELVSSDATFNVPGLPEPMRGPGGYLAIIGMMRNGFPDIQWSLEDKVVEENKVAARFIMTGTHNGIFYDVLPTGKVIKVQPINFYRVSNGQIVEEYGQPDMLGLP